VQVPQFRVDELTRLFLGDKSGIKALVETAADSLILKIVQDLNEIFGGREIIVEKDYLLVIWMVEL